MSEIDDEVGVEIEEDYIYSSIIENTDIPILILSTEETLAQIELD